MKKILTFLSILTLTPTLPTTIISCDDNYSNRPPEPPEPPTLTSSDIETIFSDTTASLDGSDLVLNSQSLNLHDFHILSVGTTALAGSIMYNQSEDNPLGLYHNQKISAIVFARSADQSLVSPTHWVTYPSGFTLEEPFVVNGSFYVKNYPLLEKYNLSTYDDPSAPTFVSESTSYASSSDGTEEAIEISIKDSNDPKHFYALFLQLSSTRIVDETRKFVDSDDYTFMKNACRDILSMMDGFVTSGNQKDDLSGVSYEEKVLNALKDPELVATAFANYLLGDYTADKDTTGLYPHYDLIKNYFKTAYQVDKTDLTNKEYYNDYRDKTLWGYDYTFSTSWIIDGASYEFEVFGDAVY